METCRRLAATFASLRLCGAALLGFHILVLGSSFRGRHRSGPTRVEALPLGPAEPHKMTKPTPNVHVGGAKLQTRTVQPKLHEDASVRRKTDEHV